MSAPNPGNATPDALVQLQETLYESRQPTRRYLHVSRRDWIFSRLEALAATTGGRHALEVGPGSGVYLPKLLALFPEVTATDIEDAYLNHARRAFAHEPRLNLHTDDITRSTIPAESCDLVLCSEVIEHIPGSRADAAIAGMARVLRPGGVLLLSTPQPKSPLELAGKVAFRRPFIWLARAVYREPVLPTGHINLMSEDRLRIAFDRAGLQHETFHATGVYLPLASELLGDTCRRLAQWLEPRLLRGAARPLLWTQYHVLRK